MCFNLVMSTFPVFAVTCKNSKRSINTKYKKSTVLYFCTDLSTANNSPDSSSVFIFASSFCLAANIPAF